ncbi:MAG: PIN domain-containing protein [Anaerolineae bacterium]
MPTQTSLRVVIDTNVVFEGLTKQGGAAGLVIDCWRAGLFRVFVANALAYEYTDVLSRKLSPTRWRLIKPILGILLTHAEFVAVYYTWRPMSPDPGDQHIIDCAMNAGAIVITENTKDFRTAREALGLQVKTPVQLLRIMEK